MKSRLLPLALTVALAVPVVAVAAEPAPRAPTAADRAAIAAARAELDRARAELERAAARVAELDSTDLERLRFQVIEAAEAAAARPGIGIVMASNPEGGVRIAAVTPDGPADKAGLRAGDVLVSVDGRRISGGGGAGDDSAIASARTQLHDLRKGQQLRIGYRRDGRDGEALVTVDDISRVMVFTRDAGNHAREARRHAEFARGEAARALELIAPGVRVDLERIAAAPCAAGDADCRVPVLSEAFRWNGLNLAALEPKLGRYFGTDRGVLVISGGDTVGGLEPGDVIRRIGGEAVATPRDAMRLLRDRGEGEKVRVDVLRERAERSVEVTVPEAPPLRWFAPPPPT
ncbi:PDZ domain-containing protein, partial [Arenimonas composti]